MNSHAPTLLLACDLGKSGGKFFYKLLHGQTHALWMDAEVAQREAAGVESISPGGRPQDCAWYRNGEVLTFVGKAAQRFLDYNSFKEDKKPEGSRANCGGAGGDR
jgi:hypothetical protein